jgi:hypothetical protein
MRPGRWRTPLILFALFILTFSLTGVLIGLRATPASAAGDGCNTRYTEEVCVHVYSSGVWGTAAHGTPGRFLDVTIYVRQCWTDRTHCGTIASNHRGYPGTSVIYTSTKPVSAGHAYIACASWDDSLNHHVVNFCGDWRTWP